MNILDKSKYYKVMPHFKEINFNCMFAKTVVNGFVDGKIHVDDIENPSSFYILHPYGMSLLMGSEKNEAFNLSLSNYLLNLNNSRKQVDWLQVYPDAWHDKLEELIGNQLIRKKHTQEVFGEDTNGAVLENTRVNFNFNHKLYNLFKTNITPKDYIITPTTKELFNKMDGTVVPKAFWKNAEQFEKHGVGYSLFINNQLVSTAYSAFIHDDQLELGIETIKSFKGKGLAAICCSKLIDYCIAKGLEPVWSCKLENTPSYKLAQKIGFRPVSTRPYYMVKV